MKNFANRSFRTPTSFAVLSGLFICETVTAQCAADWIKTDGFPGAGGLPNVVAAVNWDPDGAGPQVPRLVAGGGFDYMTDSVADKIAVLNPETGRWEDLAGGIDYISVDKKTGEIFDGGSVLSLAVYQDDLIVGGVMNEAGGVPANFIARWDGTDWTALGGGLNGFVNSMTVYHGELFAGELIATGSFITTGSGTVVNRIARWDGASWQPLGPAENPGMNGDVNNVIVYNGELIAVGNFTTAGGVPANRIARWNPEGSGQWQPLDPIGLNASAFGLAVLDDGDLYVSGNFTLAGGVPNTRGVARWDGANWHPVGGGALFAVRTLGVYQNEIIAGGAFNVVLEGQSVRGLARLDTASQTWTVMEGGFDPSGGASGFVVHDFGGGAGDELVVVGSYYKVGNRRAMGIARWSDATQKWDRFGPGFDWNPWRFTTYRGDLIAGGSFYSAGNVEARGVARRDSKTGEWHALGTGIGNTAGNVVGVIDVLREYNNELYVGGHFFNSGGVPTLNIARWNGDTETWSDVGGGVTGGEVPHVFALAEYKGDLIVGGDFDFAGGTPAFNIARWDGTQWHAMGAGTGCVNSMAIFQGELYVSVNCGLQGMQRWDGTQWHAVPGGYNNWSMTVFDGKLISGFLQPFAYDGNTWTPLPGFTVSEAGAAIYAYEVFQGELIVGGGFTNAAGIPEADGLVKFDGTSWSALAGNNGTTSFVSGMWVHNSDAGSELITNNAIKHPDGTFSHWSRWDSLCPFGDVTQNGTIDVDDLLAVINAWGPCAGCAADVTGNGIVDVDDLLAVINNWG
jgi:trimeric autotransporter adhesin